MHIPKITAEDRAALVQLKRDGKLEEMKALARRLGVSEYYGTILERRDRRPYERSRKRWDLARRAGPVLA